MTAALSLAAVILFGLWPAVRAGRVQLRDALVESGGRGIAGARSHWPRRVLVTSEVALGVVLLVGAGLLIRSFFYLRHQPPGFDPNHLVTAKISLQDARYSTAANVNHLFDESLARIRQTPGVESAGVALTLPYERPLNLGVQIIDGPHAMPGAVTTNVVYVTPQFFETLRIPVLRGRAFTPADNSDAHKVAIVNRAYVQRFFQGDDPIGFHLARNKTPEEVVGVVGDVQQRPDWDTFGPVKVTPTVYVPAAQTSDEAFQLLHTWFQPSWVVRASGDAQQTIAAIQRAVNSLDPQLPFAGFQSMREVQRHSMIGRQAEVILLATMAILALVLAAVGIYGLIANSVQERTRELGIRMALGATVRQAVSAVVIPGVALTAAGIIIGAVLALAAGGVVEHLIWGVKTTDLPTYGGVAVLLLLVAALASTIPALRVTRLSPAATLHDE
jgi:predicted permease